MALTDFERRLWDTRKDAGQCPPSLALKVALDDVEKTDKQVKHVIVVVVTNVDDGDYITMFQAGELSSLGSEGALHRAIGLSSTEWRE